MKDKRLIIIIIILQIAFLSGMVLFHKVKLRGASRIMLKTVPVDPVSIFRGHYVALRYEISRLPKTLLKDAQAKDLKEAEELFVLLRQSKESDIWEAYAIYSNLPKGNRAVYLRGRVPNYSKYLLSDSSDDIHLEYGIESFFLNEDSAKNAENANMGGRMNWGMRNKRRQELLAELDEETQRISRAGIGKWLLDQIYDEIEAWVKEGIITAQIKDTIHAKYDTALEQIKAIDEELDSGRAFGQKPVVVEVAVSQDGRGYPVKLLVDGKEYK